MMPRIKSCIYCVLLCIMALTGGCGVDEQWVKSYVGQELEPLREDRYRPLEDSLAETRAEVASLQKEVEEMKKAAEAAGTVEEGVEEKVEEKAEEKVEEGTPGSMALESVEQILKEHTEELRWLQEDLDDMYTRLTALESAAQIPLESEDVLRPTPKSVPAEVRPTTVETPVTQPLKGENLTALAEELKKLRSTLNEVSKHVEHVDQKYQEYHRDIGLLRVDLTNDIDALEGKIAVLDEKVSALKDAQRAMLAEMAKLPQRDVESLEQKLRGLIESLPK